jgi:iron complex outermembrane receptor protein
MRITGQYLTGAALAPLAMAVLMQTPARAEEAGPGANTTELAEVVVTARRRDESYRDVPITVDVFTEEKIAAAGIERPADFIALTPNMQLVQTQNVGNAFVVIRGVSQARNSEPSVAVLLDGVLETNPSEFNQQLYDIQQIEVLKGPQGALYGRDAIGGAIIIRTKPPSDQLEGSVKLGIQNGPGEEAQASVSGPIGDSKTLKFRASGSYFDTAGYIPNDFLHDKADPYRDLSGRVRLLWTPTDQFTADARLAASHTATQAFYFTVPRADPANIFSFFNDANDTSVPVTVNNRGQDDRDIYDAALKLDYATALGSLTSISAYNKTTEIATGDAFDFRPIPQSFFFGLLGVDLNQSQFLDVRAYSQELRFTSPDIGKFRWIAGVYFVHTDRFISTGNMVDIGKGVYPVYRTPSTNPINPQATFLADSQNNNAWALFGDATYEFTDRFEVDTALRYDQDMRKNTTDTPEAFLAGVNLPGFPQGFTGEVRKQTWDKLQPKITLRYKPTDTVTYYGGYSRGFRSGGFNQTGVGAIAASTGILGVHDLFDAEVADTLEAGVKGTFFNNRLNADLSVYRTDAKGSYFFVFLAANSTQNLGNLQKVIYKGAELETQFKVTDHFNAYFSYGYTDSDIKEATDPTQVGNQAPLVTKYTINLGTEYRQPIAGDVAGSVRVDWQKLGPTWWDPANLTVRDPVSLLNLRAGIEGAKWSATAWSKNLTNKKYNAEFSPGGFLFPAQPRTYGLEFMRRF